MVIEVTAVLSATPIVTSLGAPYQLALSAHNARRQGHGAPEGYLHLYV